MEAKKKLILRNKTNARKWKHQNGGTITDVKLVSKHQNGTSNGGIKRLDVESLRRDPEYKTTYNWRMHPRKPCFNSRFINSKRCGLRRKGCFAQLGNSRKWWLY